MKLKLGMRIKMLMVFIFLILSILGFMIKLPVAFRHSDKELHAVFYFAAACFLNILFTNKKAVIHVMIFAILYLFGIAIEYAQEYSNKFFHTKIHGRYDPEDVKYNLTGLVLFSAIWILYMLSVLAYKGLILKRQKIVKD
jgi:hypothetical protein